jgi:hypothetical protein
MVIFDAQYPLKLFAGLLESSCNGTSRLPMKMAANDDALFANMHLLAGGVGGLDRTVIAKQSEGEQ